MTPCRECTTEISDSAESCPHCGIKINKKMNPILKFILWFIAITFFIGMIIGIVSGTSNQTSMKSTSELKRAAQQKGSYQIAPKENWTYGENMNELHDSLTKYVSTTSTNLAYFDFPYDGGSTLDLNVRKNHKGYDVFIRISKGQIMCGWHSCEVPFRFDDGEIMSITMSESDSHAATILFVTLDPTVNKIINKLKTSKKLIISPKFYQHGTENFVFNIEGYKPI